MPNPSATTPVFVLPPRSAHRKKADNEMSRALMTRDHAGLAVQLATREGQAAAWWGRNKSGQNQLAMAIRDENGPAARALIPFSDLMAEDRNGDTALNHAASRGWEEGVGLIARACDPFQRDTRGRTPAIILAIHDCVDFESIIPHWPSSAFLQSDNSGSTALSIALSLGTARAVRALAPLSDRLLAQEDDTMLDIAVRSCSFEHNTVAAAALFAEWAARGEASATAVARLRAAIDGREAQCHELYSTLEAFDLKKDAFTLKAEDGAAGKDNPAQKAIARRI